jgi:hypothetical protein
MRLKYPYKGQAFHSPSFALSREIGYKTSSSDNKESVQ